MNQNLEEIYKKAKKYIDNIDIFIHTTTPQIDGYKKNYSEYLKSIITASGVFAALTQALLVSKLPKITLLAVVGFFLLIIAVILAFLSFRKGLVMGAVYVLALKKIRNKMVDFSGIATQFTKGIITLKEYEIKQDEFEKSYPNFRDNKDIKDFDTQENQLLEETAKNYFSSPNIISIFFVAGIILVTFSVLIPQILFLCNK